jgi:hypothetical protein
LFHHPMWISMFPLYMPKPIEEMIQFKQDRANALLEAGRPLAYIFAHERAYRITTLLELRDRGLFSTKRQQVDFWRIARNVWIDCEEDEDSDLWSDLMESQIDYRWAMTEKKDRRALRDMPSEVTVFRGVPSKNEQEARSGSVSGWQWTLSHKTARFFARRFIKHYQDPWIASATMPKDMIQAYLTMRGEAEVLIEPFMVDESEVSLTKLNSRKMESRG